MSAIKSTLFIYPGFLNVSKAILSDSIIFLSGLFTTAISAVEMKYAKTIPRNATTAINIGTYIVIITKSISGKIAISAKNIDIKIDFPTALP